MSKDDGTDRRQIVPRFADYITYTYPTWSPDGAHIAYVRVDNGHETSELWVVRSDGRELHGLSIVHVADTPAWSPGGKWIAYVGDGGLSEVLSDGSGKRTLLPRDVAFPAWSPDGRSIAFEEQVGRIVSIRELDTRDGQIRPIEHHQGSAGPLAWSPDGTRLAFTVERAGAGGSYFEIRTVRASGVDERAVTRLFVQHIDGITWRR